MDNAHKSWAGSGEVKKTMFHRHIVASTRTWIRLLAVGVFDGVSPNLRVSVSEQAQTIVPCPDKAKSKPLGSVVIMIHEMVIVYCSSTLN